MLSQRRPRDTGHLLDYRIGNESKRYPEHGSQPRRRLPEEVNVLNSMATPSGSEQQSRSLAELIRSGDAAAEQELVVRYSRGVRAILRSAAADRSVVDDLHQETFRIALEKIRRGDLREASGLSGFIASLARNLATDYFRRSRRPDSRDVATLESIQSYEAGALEGIVAGEFNRVLHRARERYRELYEKATSGRDKS